MKSINSRCSVLLVLPLALLWLAPATRAQETGDDSQPPRCTDLSGKIPLPCPSPGEPASDTVGVPNEPTAPPTSVAGEARPRGREHPDTRKDSSAGSVANAGPAAERPYAAAVRPTVISQPSAAAADPRAAIGLHPRTPPEPEPSPEPSPVASSSPASRLARSPELSLVRNLVQDQKDIWTSPLHLRLNDVQWLAPLLGAGIVTGFSDTDIQRHLPTSATLQTRSKSYSTYGVVAFAGATGAAWLWGRATHNDHLRETGILSGEAALDSFALTYAIKTATQRDRPYQGSGHGTFFSNGDSFPSEHAAAAWSMATVIAHEYPGPLTTLLAYGGAAAVSALRVTGRQHFTSDALVGSALGYFVGRHVYNAHHDREDLARYGTFERPPAAETRRSPENMGSAFVPLDSWVYGAFDRLAALGYIHTAFAGLRPWTRLECVRLLDEASSRVLAAEGSGDDALRLYRSLQAEFALDAESVAGGRNLSAELESLYTRFTGISGKPLNDSFHFGQTIINDYGRPYQEGFNMVSGFSARAEAGPLAFYVRGEYQHAPAGPALPDAARQTIAAVDLLPSVPLATVVLTQNQFRLLDAYVALNLHDWQVSAGKQSLWWGPGLGGPMMFSNNAEPINMIRFDRVAPVELPSIFRLLGPVRTEFFLGQLSGYQFVQSPFGLVGQFGRSLDSQPFIHGQKISFKPTSNLEFGFSRTTIYGGPGYPLTERTLLRSLFSTGNTLAGAANKPGDRRSGMDFTYRLPGLRNSVTFYADGFTEDEYSPVAYADRSVWRAGLYVSHFPRLSKLDLRTEGVYSDNPLGGNLGPGYFYSNVTWRDGYRNAGDLIGNWIGRAGQGVQAWATYHFAPKNFVQLNFRHQKVSREFIPGGGTSTDIGMRADLWTRAGVSVSSLVQYERWTFPVLATGVQSNITSSVQLTYWPRNWGKR
jgi:membrane-associated phospholipid phosphatase